MRMREMGGRSGELRGEVGKEGREGRREEKEGRREVLRERDVRQEFFTSVHLICVL